MFFQGSIQEGISTAVGQQKLLLCFVTDDNDESQTWENEYLQDESVNGLIVTKAIALRLKAGSEEAGYLAQIFPLPKTPTVVIMKHGELKEYIASGTTKNDFLRRLSNAFSAGNAPVSTPAPSTPAANVAAPVAMPTSTTESPAPTSSTILSASPEADGSANVRRILAERAAKAQKEAAEREAKEAEAAAAAAGAVTAALKGKGKAVVELPTAISQSNAQKEAADMIKKKKAQQNDERRRILKRIEDDKVARRELAAQRKRQRQEDLAALEAEEKEQQQAKAASRSSSSRASTAAAIQVRLSDGSTLRNKFQVAESIKDIRDWVDKERSDGNDPYFFKQILTPLPNKSIDTTEEGKSLGELGLSPSSTLLLIPIQRFAAAYDAQCPSKGIFDRIMAFVLGLFAWLMGVIGLGGGARPAAQAPSQDTANSPAALRNQRVQAFQNPNDRRGDQQLYNGNSLNFEPRPDEEEN
ncbi:UBX domain protein [Cordyceps fumosorosea ARSEF 2679]|uniref:UBX domain-containing protein 2 n=1 Tax=Cordyceps fumosorosea (strain ARSEF 2679) TaxID=1081104 RepID=A0A167SYL7_CORFA|nr:UBX domain protein [Cordyceps fumosorosea ARSEF 2679]OAA60066.1 UBX domain protein [Cordyceps fumosorosea ARSEF 2679]